jgi:hypothetical protein
VTHQVLVKLGSMQLMQKKKKKKKKKDSTALLCFINDAKKLGFKPQSIPISY